MAIELGKLKIQCPCPSNLWPERGCDGRDIPHPWLEFEDEITGQKIQIKGCPYAQITTQTQEFLRLYSFWKKGLLPFEGTILEQSAKYIEAMEYLDEVFAQKEYQEIENAKRTRTRNYP